VLTLVAKNIGQGNGASLSALDVLISLGQIDPEMALIYLYKNDIPNELDGKKVLYSQSYLSPRSIDGTSKFNLKKVSNIVVKPFLMNKLKNISPRMSFVNSMGSHSLWKPIKEKYNWSGTLIVRESPDLYKSSSIESILNRFNYYDYFIFVSDLVRKKWLKFSKIDAAKSFYIPNCVWEKRVEEISQNSKSNVKKKLFGNDDQFIAICTGEVKYRKGQDLIIENLKLICNLIPNFKLLLLGRQNQTFVKELKSSLKKMNLEKRVEFIPHQPNAIEYIYAADVLLQPSRSEALPRTILEAMALKTPIVASDVDGIPELVGDNTSAILFSLSNIDKMIKGIHTIFLNDSFRNQITEKAYKRYWDNFSREKHIQKYSEFINQIPYV
jgi:glycosyltransferase involved in cell wall biosynthesis